MGHLPASLPPFVREGHLTSTNIANPLPQAMILTAIVIGFGLLTFALALVRKVWKRFNTLDSDRLRLAEPSYRSEEE